jgi:hypothetical protein
MNNSRTILYPQAAIIPMPWLLTTPVFHFFPAHASLTKNCAQEPSTKDALSMVASTSVLYFRGLW